MPHTRLTKSKSLVGQEETITAMDLRKTPGDILMQVQMGEIFNITRNGVIVAVLSAPEMNALELGAEVRRIEHKREREQGG
jgi:antitoxin (DNA-binding transcriptional repressor) of toxin-antitoxin stability system